jgi:hypothetical protein
MHAFLMWLSARLPARIIAHEGRPYLERYYVATLLDQRVYLHRFVDSDPDGVHDHPWLRSLSILLFGWYWEHRVIDGALVVRRVRWLNWITGGTFHRVVLPNDVRWEEWFDVPAPQCWALFIHSPRKKAWGTMRQRETYPGGPTVQVYEQHEPEPPAPFSDWYKRAPKGRDVVGRQP